MKYICRNLLISFAVAASVVICKPITAQAAPVLMPNGEYFDAQFYAATYPDVYKAFGTNSVLLYQHYVYCGRNEGRLPCAGYVAPEKVDTIGSDLKVMPDGNLFDPIYYANTYPDVVAVFGRSEKALYNHYLLCGRKEGRKAYSGAVKSDAALDFYPGGVVAAPSSGVEDVIALLRQAAAFRIPELVIKVNDYPDLTADSVEAIVANEKANLKASFGARVTGTKPMAAGSVDNLQITVTVTFRY